MFPDNNYPSVWPEWGSIPLKDAGDEFLRVTGLLVISHGSTSTQEDAETTSSVAELNPCVAKKKKEVLVKE